MNAESIKNRRLKLTLGLVATVLMMISDLLWKIKGPSQIKTTLGTFADTAWLDTAMWQLIVSNLLFAAAMPLYYIGFRELYHMVQERAANRLDIKLAKLFKFSVIAAVISLLFIHILCVNMPLILKALAPHLDIIKAAEITNSIMMANIGPMIIYFVAADGLMSVVWCILVWRRCFPVNRLALLCNPVCAAALGSILAQAPWPISLIDTVAEPCGHLLLMIVALIILNKDSRQTPVRRRRPPQDDLPPVYNLDDDPDADVTVI